MNEIEIQNRVKKNRKQYEKQIESILTFKSVKSYQKTTKWNNFDFFVQKYREKNRTSFGKLSRQKKVE